MSDTTKTSDLAPSWNTGAERADWETAQETICGICLFPAPACICGRHELPAESTSTANSRAPK